MLAVSLRFFRPYCLAPADFHRSVNPTQTRVVDYAHHITTWHPGVQNHNTSPITCITYVFNISFYSKQGQQQNKEVMSGLDSDDETDSDGTIDDKYNLCKEKGPSRRSLAIQSGCKVNRQYLLS